MRWKHAYIGLSSSALSYWSMYKNFLQPWNLVILTRYPTGSWYTPHTGGRTFPVLSIINAPLHLYFKGSMISRTTVCTLHTNCLLKLYYEIVLLSVDFIYSFLSLVHRMNQGSRGRSTMAAYPSMDAQFKSGKVPGVCIFIIICMYVVLYSIKYKSVLHLMLHDCFHTILSWTNCIASST